MNIDEYGTVLNGDDTFQEIGMALVADGMVLIPWTDQEGTQLDILLAWKPSFCAPSHHLVQGGVRPSDLFVSIMRMGSFGFDIKDMHTHGGYYAEKLHLSGGSTSERLAELLNGVKAAILSEL